MQTRWRCRNSKTLRMFYKNRPMPHSPLGLGVARPLICLSVVAAKGSLVRTSITLHSSSLLFTLCTFLAHLLDSMAALTAVRSEGEETWSESNSRRRSSRLFGGDIWRKKFPRMIDDFRYLSGFMLLTSSTVFDETDNLLFTIHTSYRELWCDSRSRTRTIHESQFDSKLTSLKIFICYCEIQINDS